MCSSHVREETARTLQVAAYHSETDVYQNNSAPGIFIARGRPSPVSGFSPQPFGEACSFSRHFCTYFNQMASFLPFIYVPRRRHSSANIDTKGQENGANE